MAYLSMGEAHRRIIEYLNRFSEAVSSQDGPSLKPLLAVSSNSPQLLSLADSLNIFQVLLPTLSLLDQGQGQGFALLLFFFFPSLLRRMRPGSSSNPTNTRRLGKYSCPSFDPCRAFESGVSSMPTPPSINRPSILLPLSRLILGLRFLSVCFWIIGPSGNGGIAVRFFRNFATGNRRGRWKLFM